MSHEPWRQAELALSSAQLLPQAPQFRSSVSVSVHAPAHDFCPLRQAVTHTPLLQTWPLLQAFPQTPQFALSLLSRVQASPQALYPSSQTSVQEIRPCSGGLAVSLLPVPAVGEVVAAVLATLAAAPEPHANKVSAAAEQRPASDPIRVPIDLLLLSMFPPLATRRARITLLAVTPGHKAAAQQDQEPRGPSGEGAGERAPGWRDRARRDWDTSQWGNWSAESWR
jgi:hypothetical protein